MNLLPFKPWEAELAFRYLRAKRRQGGVALISIISFVGIMLAVAVLIIVMSVMNGFRVELLDKILGFNGHAYVAGAVLEAPDREAVLRRVRATRGVTRAYPVVNAQAMALGQGQITGAIVRGVRPGDPGALDAVRGAFASGGLQGFGQGEYGGDLVLVGQGLAAMLGVSAGDPVTLISPTGEATPFGSTPRQKTYTVGGVFNVGMSEYDAAFIYMPLEQAQLFFGRGESVDEIEVMLDDPDRLDQVKPRLRQAAGPTAFVTDWRDRNQTFFNALQVERSVMRLILMLIVAIAAMNIISGLVMLVKNKGRDIAVLRTMGARRGAILRLFFLSGAIIGAAGVVAGLILGTIFCIYIGPIQDFVEGVTGTEVFAAEQYYLPKIPAKVEWREVVLVTFWSLAMSFLATLPPAFRASRLDPVEALRYE